ncbi:MAG: LacI family DNA-binding transcriptional regulator [bacterium]
MAPSITDVARLAKVSVGTVSRVMNGETSVNADLRRRVLLESRRIGFVPKIAHTRLALMSSWSNSVMPVGYTSIMTSLITRFVMQRKLGVEIVDMDNLDTLYDSGIKAAIGIVFDDRIAALHEIPNLPVLTINHPMVNMGIHSLYTDHFEQGMSATKHLLEKGHRRIAFMADLSTEWGGCERRRGYEQAMKEAGLTVDPSWVRFSEEAPIYDILRRWVRDEATAILNFGERVGPEAIHVLQSVFNLQIGRDISTITLEELPFYQYLSPPQTVIRQPLEELARLAVDSAMELAGACGQGKASRKVLDIRLHGELVERDSVADLRGGKPQKRTTA